MPLIRPTNRVLYFSFFVILAIAFLQQRTFYSLTAAYSGKENKLVTMSLPEKEDDFQIALDIVEVTSDYLAIAGWIRFADHPSSSMETFLFLKNEKDTIFLSAIPAERTDVAEYFKTKDLRFSGFSVIYPTCKIKSGSYQLGVLLDSKGSLSAKISDRMLSIPSDNSLTAMDCDERSKNIASRDKLSVQDLILRNAGRIRVSGPIGFVTDSLSPSLYQLKYREVQFSLIPTLVKMSVEPDTLIAYFPATHTINNPKNPLNNEIDQWTVLNDFGNSIYLLSRNTTSKTE